MQISRSTRVRKWLFIVLITITRSAIGQTELGYGPGMFIKDIAVSREARYILSHFNAVHVYNQNGEFAGAFPVLHQGTFPSLTAIEVDKNNHLHIVDDDHDIIHVYTNSGALLRQIQLEPGTYRDVALDLSGYYHLVERSANIVRIVSPDGINVREFGAGIFGNLSSIHVSRTGEIFTCDLGVYQTPYAPQVRVFDYEGNFIEDVGSSGYTYNTYSEPAAVQTDDYGYVYVYDGTKVLQYFPFFSIRQQYRIDGEDQGVVYAGKAFCLVNNTLFFGDLRHRIQVFNTSLVYQHTIGGSSKDDGRFDVPSGIAVDKDNFIYVADSKNHRIQVFDENGSFVRAFGSYGTEVDRFYAISDVAVDDKNNWIYVLDNSLIKTYSKEGAFQGSFATGLLYPSRITTDKDGHLYINNSSNRRVDVFSGTGDLVRSLQTSFDPMAMTIGPDDLVYVTVRTSSEDVIEVFNGSGDLVRQMTLPGRRPHMYGIAVRDEYIFTSDAVGVRKFTNDGVLVAAIEGRGDAVGRVNMKMPNGATFTPDLAIWKNRLLISDILRVQSTALEQSIASVENIQIPWNAVPVFLPAISSAGMPVQYTVSDPEVASLIDGTILKAIKPGQATITATQPGYGFLAAADPVVTPLLVTLADQVISFSAVGERILGDAPIKLQASSSSGLPVTIISQTPAIASISENVVTLLDQGTAILQALQEGNEWFEPASSTQSFPVKLVTGTIEDLSAADVYPNPTSNRVTIRVGGHADGSFSLVDHTGRQVPCEVVSTSDLQTEISLAHLPPGVYFMHTKGRANRNVVYKIIKL